MLACVDNATICIFLFYEMPQILIMPCRWLKKRIMRYGYISCKLGKGKKRDRKGEGSLAGTLSCGVPPLLPSILAACAPSTRLSLDVQSSQGKPLSATNHI